MKKEFGILAFWLLIAFLVSTILGFYYYPAVQKLEKLEVMNEKSNAENDILEIKTTDFTKELAALNDPFYIEKLLRTRYKWVPKNKVKTIDESILN
ncbi:MAG: hypothetical protein K8S87_08360 [Planctomycetes bacterium]|nr:hypothetical protein [Planctomycetota bacterium]